MMGYDLINIDFYFDFLIDVLAWRDFKFVSRLFGWVTFEHKRKA